MCKYNRKCTQNCVGKCKTKVSNVIKNVIFDSSNVNQGPTGPALIPEETNKVFTI